MLVSVMKATPNSTPMATAIISLPSGLRMHSIPNNPCNQRKQKAACCRQAAFFMP